MHPYHYQAEKKMVLNEETMLVWYLCPSPCMVDTELISVHSFVHSFVCKHQFLGASLEAGCPRALHFQASGTPVSSVQIL